MNRTTVNEEHMKSVPKRILTKFDRAISSLSKLQRGRYFSANVTSKTYQEFRLVKLFFDKEVAKMMIDLYLATSRKKFMYRFDFHIMHHIHIIELRISTAELGVRSGVWGGPDSWIEIGEIDVHSLYDECECLKDRIGALLNWRAAFHYYSSAKMNQGAEKAVKTIEIVDPF